MALIKLSVPKKWFSYFSTKTYVVGTQKNRLTQNICKKLWASKYLQFYAEHFCLSKPVRLAYKGTQQDKN